MSRRDIELEITDEMKQLGFSRIRVVDKNLLVYNNGREPIYCQHDRYDISKTVKRLRKALNDFGEFDEDTIEKFLVLLSRLLLNSEIVSGETERKEKDKKSVYEKARLAEIAAIKAEIERIKNAHIAITCEDWRIGLVERHNELQKIVNANIPEIWSGLEFALSSLRILNIHDCTLPLIGIILGRPSSYKTVILNLLKPWYCTFYTDSFSPKAWVTHTTAVDSEEELMKIDMLPKVKDRLF